MDKEKRKPLKERLPFFYDSNKVLLYLLSACIIHRSYRT